MKPGNYVKTKSPGFGTGPVSRRGIIIELYNIDPNSSHITTVDVLHDDGIIMQWYPWQLKVVE
jgi:hypothetical protein